MFDDLLRESSWRSGVPLYTFDRPTDYDENVERKPRLLGAGPFLRSGGIDLAMGPPSDPPDAETVHAVGTHENDIVLELIRQQGVEPCEGSVRFVEAIRGQRPPGAVVASSTDGQDVPVAAGIKDVFEGRIDGVVAERDGLVGEPGPDTSLAGAPMFRAAPAQAAVFGDALAGVEAGRGGNFGCVVGADRTGQAAALSRRGADVVVQDLGARLGRR